MEVRLSPEQEARLARLAARKGRKADELAQDVLRCYLEEEARFVAAVERGLGAADRGEFLESGEVWARVERLFQD
jgi:predicted transcriptional regulator